MNKIFKLLLIVWFIISTFSIANCQTITTVAGGVTGHGGYWGDGGPATAAQLNLFFGLIVDQNGNIYISTSNRIRKVDAATDIINTIAGTGVSGYNGDGIPATAAQLSNTGGCLSFDNNENLYLYDGVNNRIRRIDAVTGIISTYAGNGIADSTGDGGPATSAAIDGRGDMAWDAAGNLYFASVRKIRKVTPAGIISTFAGNGLPGVTGDGVPATATYLAPMNGLAFDASGNLYCADSTLAVRKIDASTGIITRVAGTGDNIASPYSGDGMPATACHLNPFDISVDSTGNVYISDYANSRIEKVDAFGAIYTIAGTGIAGFSGDSGPATSAEIGHPENVVLDQCNNVYIADFNNARVRKVTYHATCATGDLNVYNANPNSVISIYPNPASLTLTLSTDGEGTYRIMSIESKVMQQGLLKEGSNSISIQSLPEGMYMVEVIDKEGKRTIKKIIKQ